MIKTNLILLYYLKKQKNSIYSLLGINKEYCPLLSDQGELAHIPGKEF